SSLPSTVIMEENARPSDKSVSCQRANKLDRQPPPPPPKPPQPSTLESPKAIITFLSSGSVVASQITPKSVALNPHLSCVWLGFGIVSPSRVGPVTLAIVSAFVAVNLNFSGRSCCVVDSGTSCCVTAKDGDGNGGIAKDTIIIINTIIEPIERLFFEFT